MDFRQYLDQNINSKKNFLAGVFTGFLILASFAFIRVYQTESEVSPMRGLTRIAKDEINRLNQTVVCQRMGCKLHSVLRVNNDKEILLIEAGQPLKRKFKVSIENEKINSIELMAKEDEPKLAKEEILNLISAYCGNYNEPLKAEILDSIRKTVPLIIGTKSYQINECSIFVGSEDLDTDGPGI